MSCSKSTNNYLKEISIETQAIQKLVNSPEFINYYGMIGGELHAYKAIFEQLSVENRKFLRSRFNELILTKGGDKQTSILAEIKLIMGVDLVGTISSTKDNDSWVMNRIITLPQPELTNAMINKHLFLAKNSNDITRHRGWWWIYEDISWCQTKCSVLYTLAATTCTVGTVVAPVGIACHAIAFVSFVDCVTSC